MVLVALLATELLMAPPPAPPPATFPPPTPLPLMPTIFIEGVPVVEERFVVATEVADVDREFVADTNDERADDVAAAATAATAAAAIAVVDFAKAVGGKLVEAGFKAVMEAFWLLLVEALRWLADCEVMTEVEAAAATAAIPWAAAILAATAALCIAVAVAAAIVVADNRFEVCCWLLYCCCCC